MKDLSILIIGYDPYSDIWKVFFDCINKNWPYRPNTYLITNKITPQYKNVVVKAAGEEAEWSKKVQIGLDLINEKYVCLLLEDFFIGAPVNNEDIENVINIMKQQNSQYYKLLDQKLIKGRPISVTNKKTLILDADEKYGISLQPAIWERDLLRLHTYTFFPKNNFFSLLLSKKFILTSYPMVTLSSKSFLFCMYLCF